MDLCEPLHRMLTPRRTQSFFVVPSFRSSIRTLSFSAPAIAAEASLNVVPLRGRALVPPTSHHRRLQRLLLLQRLVLVSIAAPLNIVYQKLMILPWPMPCPRLASFDWIGKVKYFEIELWKASVYQAIDRSFQQIDTTPNP